MKKSLLFVLSGVLSITNTFAQFELDSYYKMASGDKIKVYQLDTFALEGAPGSNKVWDFSLSTIQKLVGTTFYSSYNGVGDVFSEANIKLTSDSSSTIVYYKQTDSEQSLVGNFTVTEYGVDDIYTTGINNPLQKYIVYPLEYYIENKYDYQSTYESSYQGDVYNTVIRSGYTTVKYDAYGSLKLPNNINYGNVIRVKFVQYLIDSTDFYGTPKVYKSKVTTYNFYAEKVRMPVLGISYTDISQESFLGHQTAHSKIVQLYENNLVNGIEDELLLSCNTLYPNPVEHNSFLNISDEIVSLELFNSTGELVLLYSDESRKINIALSEGIYLVKAKCKNDKVLKQKLVVK